MFPITLSHTFYLQRTTHSHCLHERDSPCFMPFTCQDMRHGIPMGSGDPSMSSPLFKVQLKYKTFHKHFLGCFLVILDLFSLVLLTELQINFFHITSITIKNLNWSDFTTRLYVAWRRGLALIPIVLFSTVQGPVSSQSLALQKRGSVPCLELGYYIHRIILNVWNNPKSHNSTLMLLPHF